MPARANSNQFYHFKSTRHGKIAFYCEAETATKAFLQNPNIQAIQSPYPATNDAMLSDHVGRLRSGQKVRIKGTRRVYEEMHKRNTIICQCSVCETYLQVSKESVNMFCSVCHNISSVESNSGHSLSSTAHLDNEIAKNMQRQEYDVASALLWAKVANNEKPSSSKS